MKRLLPGLLLFLTSPLFAFNSHKPFDISADMIDYLDESQLITAEGHVVVVQTSSTLTADYLQYDREKNRLMAKGHVILRDKGQVFAGDFLDYDMAHESGKMVDSRTFASPWKMQASSWQRELDYYAGRDVSATSCDLVDPHYHLRATRMHFIPNRFFWSWNNVLYVDQTPVFYTPFLYRSLEPRRVVFQAEPGHDSVNGAFARTTTTIRLTNNVYDKVLYDYYALTGNGIGDEFDYAPNKNLKGSFFAYYIDPKGNPELEGAPKAPQYNIRSYHWEKLSNQLTLQSNVNIRDNISFNNQFFQQDTNQAVSDVTSSIALTKQTKQFTQRLVTERLDSPDPGDTSLFAQLHTQTASYPRYEFTMFQKPLWQPKVSTTTFTLHPGPLQLTASGSFDNRYERADDQTRLIGSGQATLSQTFPLGRRFTLTPTLTPSVRWQDKPDPTTVNLLGISTSTVSTGTVIPINLFHGTQGRISNADTLRYRASNALTLDNTYTLTERMAPDGVGLDRALADGGVETNHITSLLFWRPSRTILMRSYSGYDLRRIAEEDPNFYRQRRVDPWTTELTYTPRKSAFDYFFRYQLGYFPTRDTLSEGSIAYTGIHNTRLESGILYNQGQPGVLTSDNRFGYFFSPGWRLDATVHAFIPTAEGAVGQFIDTELILVRDMHCWQSQFIYRFTPPFTQEYSILFNLKFNVEGEKQITDQELESQFYPWRTEPYAR